MIQPTSTSIASPSARKKPSSVSRALAGLRAMASASSSVKTMSGSMAPPAAAAIGLVGISEVSQLANPGASPLGRELARRLGGAGRQRRPRAGLGGQRREGERSERHDDGGRPHEQQEEDQQRAAAEAADRRAGRRRRRCR